MLVFSHFLNIILFIISLRKYVSYYKLIFVCKQSLSLAFSVWCRVLIIHPLKKKLTIKGGRTKNVLQLAPSVVSVYA